MNPADHPLPARAKGAMLRTPRWPEERELIANLLLDTLDLEVAPLFPTPKDRTHFAELLAHDQMIVAEADGALIGVLVWEVEQRPWLRRSHRTAVRHLGWGLGTLRFLTQGLLLPSPLPGCLTVAALAVSERARGRGAGRQLLDFAGSLALAQGHTRLGLLVVDARPRSRALYEREGFRPVSVERLGGVSRLLGLRFSAVHRMERLLDGLDCTGDLRSAA